jgi:hypothetical protein
MVYGAQSCWVSGDGVWRTELLGFWTLSIVWNYKHLKNPFRKLDVFPSSYDGRKTPALLGSLEITNLNNWSSD